MQLRHEYNPSGPKIVNTYFVVNGWPFLTAHGLVVPRLRGTGQAFFARDRMTKIPRYGKGFYSRRNSLAYKVILSSRDTKILLSFIEKLAFNVTFRNLPKPLI